MTTVIVGAILILMLINEDNEFDLLTSASVGIDSEQDIDNQFDFNSKKTEELIVSESEIPLQMHVDTIPQIKEEEVSIPSLTIESRDVMNRIQLNQQELELKNLERLTITLKDFTGDIYFDDFVISLKGEVYKLSINGVVISRKGPMKLSIDSLSYDSLALDDVQFSQFAFRSTDGTIIVPDKLNYGLNNDDIDVEGFEGDLSIGLTDESYVNVDGQVKSFAVSGGLRISVK
jgi:hypothetical protein